MRSIFPIEIENHIYSFVHRASEEQNMKTKLGWFFSNIVLPQLIRRVYWNKYDWIVTEYLYNIHRDIRKIRRYDIEDRYYIKRVRIRGNWFPEYYASKNIYRLKNMCLYSDDLIYNMIRVHDELLYSDKALRFRRRLGFDL